MPNPYELTFWGDALGKFPRFRRHHPALEDAIAEARRVWHEMEIERGPIGETRTMAHPAIIFGPGCGSEGKMIHPEAR